MLFLDSYIKHNQIWFTFDVSVSDEDLRTQAEPKRQW